ncbi:MAG: Arc family DNA-binding protein [Anaerovoracaceae bacterium]
MSEKDHYTKQEDSRFTLRIPTELLELIREEARKNKRSTGKQIEFILERWISENNPEE